MNFSAPFVRRPVATTLLSLGLVVAGSIAFFKLPVSPLPDVDIPTIAVQATLPGASPADVAATVASPLERRLGQIADVTEMTSASSLGSARVTMQFGIGRDINGAARDVQAAINAARADLPTSLRSNPTYRKFNPASAPILIYTLTSETLTPAELYDAASTVLSQKLSQVEGVGEVAVSGGSLPAVRVELVPSALYKYGIGLEDVRAALGSANAHSPKGGIDVRSQRYQIYSNDQARKAEDYRSLIVAYRNGAAVRLSDVGDVIDSVENVRTLGLSNGKPAVVMIVYRQPGANIIQMVDRVKALMPQLLASVSPAIDIDLAVDRSKTIRASLQDVEITLLIAVALVILVVFAFLRNARATLVPVVAVSVSLVATFAVMYLLGYSLDIFSLMALTVATGFVVDDAIVVLENITRHMDAGMPRLQATLLGAREVGFTVLSMSVSLIAVFVPILLMGGLVGRLFREFAMTITIAILISLVVSLTTTPMMCAVLLRDDRGQPHGRIYRISERIFEAMLNGYRWTLAIALRHPLLVMLILVATLGLNFHLYRVVPKGFVPQQDTGLLIGSIQADQHTSFQLMRQKLTQFINIVKSDPAVATVVGFTGGGGPGPGGATNTGTVFASLKPIGERKMPADQVIERLRDQLAAVAGATLFLQSVGDLGAGGRSGNAAYQYTLQGSTFEQLNEWTPKLVAALQANPSFADVSSDQQNKALQSNLVIDRDAASRLGITLSQIDNTLYDAFGQRQVSTIYVARNQYHVIMEVAPPYSQNPQVLKEVYISTSGGPASGSQTTNAVAGTVAFVRAKNLDRFGRGKCGTKSRDQLDRRHRQGGLVDRNSRQHHSGDDDPALQRGPLRRRRDAAGRQSPGSSGRQHRLLQSAAGRLAEHGRHGDRGDHEPDRHALGHPRRFRGSCQDLPAVAGERAVSHRGCLRHHLHLARHALRELRSSAHDPVDAAFRRCRRGAGADAVAHAIRHHRDDRGDPPDRHREEERHHDDRLRCRRRASARSVVA